MSPNSSVSLVPTRHLLPEIEAVILKTLVLSQRWLEFESGVISDL